MADPAKYWSGKVAKYGQQAWASKPSLFAEECIKYFPKKGRLLELGAGYGNDGLWFAEQGYDVTQSDIEDFRSDKSKKLPFISSDLNKPLDITKKFDVIYSHLSLHYFSSARSVELIEELHSLLEDDGILAFLVNSTDDPEIGEGEKIENNFYKVDGIKKRYFNVDYTRDLTNSLFDTLLIDNNGTSYKDREAGMVHLVRFVGRKR